MRLLLTKWPLHLCPPSRGRLLPRGECWIYTRCKGSVVGLQYLPWKGICWRAVRVSKSHPFDGPLAGPPNRRPEVKKKEMSKAAAEASHLAAMETERFADMLSLVEHLATVKYEDGDPRQPGFIILRTNGSAYQAVVKDPDTGMAFTAAGKTLDEALETAALYLGTDSAPWEPDAFLKRQVKKKGK